MVHYNAKNILLAKARYNRGFWPFPHKFVVTGFCYREHGALRYLIGVHCTDILIAFFTKHPWIAIDFTSYLKVTNFAKLILAYLANFILEDRLNYLSHALISSLVARCRPPLSRPLFNCVFFDFQVASSRRANKKNLEPRKKQENPSLFSFLFLCSQYVSFPRHYLNAWNRLTFKCFSSVYSLTVLLQKDRNLRSERTDQQIWKSEKRFAWKFLHICYEFTVLLKASQHINWRQQGELTKLQWT